MFDHKAVHIDDPQGAIRSRPRLHGPKPVVFRGEKFALLLVRGAITAECDTVRLENEPVDEVVDRFADKRIAVKIGAQQIIAIDGQAAGRSRAPGRVGIVEPFQYPAGGKELIRIGIGWHEDPRGRRREERIAAKSLIGQGIMPEQRAVVAPEPVAPVVARAPLLREARGRLEVASVGVHPEIAAADAHLRAGRGCGRDSAGRHTAAPR